MSIASQVYDAIDSDDEDGTARLIEAYMDATPDQKAVVDDIFISLCGWSLNTLIKREEAP
jgi:hypothetical protein